MKSLNPPIRFKFDLDKLISSVAYFAKAGLHDLDKLKICKLLYYADKYHLIRHGRPIIGDTYIHMDNGPVPSKSLDILNEVIAGDKVYSLENEISNQVQFKKFLKVEKSLLKHQYPVIQLVRNPDFDALSESEQDALKAVVSKYGRCSPVELIQLTHQDAPWQKSPMNSEIDYRLFFEGDPDAKPEALEYMESMRENYDIMFGLE